MTAADQDAVLQAWLEQPGLDLRGVDAAVVHDQDHPAVVAMLVDRGCQVRAFDARAIPEVAHGRYGLVVAPGTASALSAAQREPAMIAMSALVGPGGYLVATFLLATSEGAVRAAEGPPWPLMPSELAAFRATGLDRLELAHAPRAAGPMMESLAVFHRP